MFALQAFGGIMRPYSIIQFDRFFLSSMGLGIINVALSFQDNLARLEADPTTAQMGLGSGFLVLTTSLGFAIPLLLWYFVSRRASNVAKWILIGLTALGVLTIIPSLQQLAQVGTFTVVATLLITALQIIALTFLFRGDAKTWLASRGRSGTDPDVFR